MNADVAVALGSVPEEARAALEALWALDEALGRVLTTGREPMIKRIRLVWWRDALEALDSGAPPQEPVLQALGAHVLPRGVSGGSLAAMEAGWTAILGDAPVRPEELDSYAVGRGGLLFEAAAMLLGEPRAAVRGAGESRALVDIARHSSEAHDVEGAMAAGQARVRAGALPRRWSRRLRPLGMLAVLAARDLTRAERWEEPGAPPRVARMMRHKLTGW
jgi:phytoene synthase